VGDILFAGDAPYNLPHFFDSLAKGLAKQEIKTEDIKKITDKFSIVYNERLAEDKKR
jgi:hypothetical protein